MLGCRTEAVIVDTRWLSHEGIGDQSGNAVVKNKHHHQLSRTFLEEMIGRRIDSPGEHVTMKALCRLTCSSYILKYIEAKP